MPSYLHPGVYVEEIPSGSKPIEGVGTSTAAFIGYTTKGPIGEPELIFKWDDYDKQYGGVRDTKLKIGDPMGMSVAAFFQNGGTAAYIVRITKDWNGSNPLPADKGEEAVAYLDNPTITGAGDSTNFNGVKFTAINEGTWANGMVVQMSVSSIDSNLYDVDIGWKNNDGEFSAAESFTNVSMDSTNPQYIEGVMNDVSELATVALVDVPDTFTSDNYLGTSTSGDLGGVSLDFSGLSAANRKLKIALDGGSEDTITLPGNNYIDLDAVAKAIENEIRGIAASPAGTPNEHRTAFTCFVENNRLVLTSGSRKSSASVVVNSGFGIALTLKLGIISVPYTATSTSDDLSGPFFPLTLSHPVDFPDADSRTLKGEVDGVAFTPLVLPSADIADLADLALAINVISGLTCTTGGNKLVLTSDNILTNTSSIVIDSAFGIAPSLKLGVGNGGVEVSGQQYYDANLRTELTGQVSADATTSSEDVLEGGGDGQMPETADYEAVFTAFLKYRDINIICLPGQSWPKDKAINVEGLPVIDAAIAHAEKMKSRMVIVDPPDTKELETQKGVIDLTLPNKTYSVLYYPWVKVANPFYNAETNPGAFRTVLVPPCGYAAGMWAKTDGRRGVWKAPAGLETGILGAAGLQYVVEDGEQDQLNPLGVNCLRKVAGSGPVIWGSRTLATKADPEWRYVPVRRTAIMIEQSIYGGIQWAVFEPNKHTLWSALRANIGNFMNGLFRAGAFQGEKASDAYFVRCGLGDTMTQGEIDAGQVIVIVGFAPLKPAEFVIVRIQQKVNQQ